mmetsp:Transcript_13086/g.59069  ORF Transcript_13086/g.59069 Transcript_13086/m.59069 type:complete len:273 (-) Transcript_13086:64-882(-)
MVPAVRRYPVDTHGVARAPMSERRSRRPRRVVLSIFFGEQSANLLARASQLGERGDGVDGVRAVADDLLVARHRRALVPGAPVRLGEGHGDGQGSCASRDGFEFGQRRAVLAQGEVASADLELEGRLVHRPQRRRRGRLRRCEERGGVLGGARGGHAARRGRRYPGRRGGLRRAHRRGSIVTRRHLGREPVDAERLPERVQRSPVLAFTQQRVAEEREVSRALGARQGVRTARCGAQETAQRLGALPHLRREQPLHGAHLLGGRHVAGSVPG